MFSGFTNDSSKEVNNETNLTKTKQADTRLMTFAAQANFPQGAMNTSLPLSVGGIGINLSLINFALFSVQVNISNGGDSQSISVNGITQNQSNEG